MKSLQQRLHISLTLALLLLFALLWLVGQKSMDELTHEFVVSRLEHDIETLLAAIEIEPETVHIKHEQIAPIYKQPFSGHYFSIQIDDKPIIYSRSLWDQTLKSAALLPGERLLQTTDGPENQSLLLISMGFSKKERNVSISLAEDLTAIHSQKNRFKKHFAIFALSGLIILLILQSIILRWSFKRLKTIQREIKQLSDGTTFKLSADVPAEVLPLVKEINHLITLLEQRLQRSRNALGNLAHALKTPLNLLFQYFDQHPEKAPEARQQLERIQSLMDRELKRARLAGKGNVSQCFDASKEVPELISVVKQIYLDRHIAINAQIEESLTFNSDREDMLELLGNLLDNACKWAQSEVAIRISSPSKNFISITIEDDGRGVTNEQLKSLTQRGRRLDESVEGHGLGLAIVNDIVKLYGGSISFSQAALGGLQIKITFNFKEP